MDTVDQCTFAPVSGNDDRQFCNFSFHSLISPRFAARDNIISNF